MFGLGVLGSLGTVPGNSGPSFDPAASAFFARIPTQTSARYALLNTVFVGLRAAGILPLLDCLWLMAAADTTTARTNLISSSFTLTPVASPAFTVDRGYTGDGSAAYLNTNYNPASGVKFKQNDAHAFFYDRLNVGSATNISMSAYNGSGSPLLTKVAGVSAFYRINDNGPAGAHVTPLGMYHADRTGGAAKSLYINGVAALSDTTTASQAVTPLNIYLLASNTSGTAGAFSTDNLAAAGAGGSLGAALAAQYYSITQAYMTAIGAQV